MVQYVITLANSVVGVSVLALPFCFQQCGIVLATLMLILSAIMTRVVCHFLLKGGIVTRRRTYELLAYHTYGPSGKLLAELTIIGFLLGTLIAFLVVMGDLGPQILAESFDINNDDSLRTIVMTGLALFVALPLGLLRNIDSLGSVSIVTLMFYVILVCKILVSGIGPLWDGSCLNQLNYWRPAGILQCIPIFALALSCQTQIFPIYDSLSDPSLSKMNSIVKNAVYLCTVFYFCVGFFGYVAFCSEPVTGNILVNFKPTWSTQFIKCCFVFSIALSVPLVILPCRASLHSMIWRDSLTYHHIHEASSNYIPEGRLRLLTVTLVGSTLVIGLMIPNIELVLGLVGSTAGSVICIIFPALMFISLTPKNTTEKIVAKAVLVIGIAILILTTYATLYAVEKANVQDPFQNKIRMSDQLSEGSSNSIGLQEKEKIISENVNFEKLPSRPSVVVPSDQISQAPALRVAEPVVPVEPRVQSPVVEVNIPEGVILPKKSNLSVVMDGNDRAASKNSNVERKSDPGPGIKIPEIHPEPVAVPLEKKVPDTKQIPENNGGFEAKQVDMGGKIDDLQIVPPQNEGKVNEPGNEIPKDPVIDNKLPFAEAIIPIPKEPSLNSEELRHGRDSQKEILQTGNQTAAGVIDSKPQETKPIEPSPQKSSVPENAAAEDLLKRLEQQQEEQRKLIEEQKQVLEELKKHHEEHDQADAAEDEVNKNNIVDKIDKPQLNIGGSDNVARASKELPPKPIDEKKDTNLEPDHNIVLPSPVNKTRKAAAPSEAKAETKDSKVSIADL